MSSANRHLRLSERRLTAWILLAAIGCLAAMAVPFFLGQVYVADDLGEFHLPVRDFYARQLALGEPFDWMSGLYGGFYIAAEGQLGAYHPWHLLLYRALPLGAAFNLEILASYPFLFAGCYLLFRRLVARRDAALFAALVFTFGGFNLLHFVHPNAIAVVAHLPWMLWTIDVAMRTTRPQIGAATLGMLAILLASQLLLGYPQYVWFSLLAVTAYVATLLVRGRAPARRLLGVSAALLAGVLIGGVQWIPTWYLLRQSARSVSDAAFANTGSLHPLNFIQLIAPYLFTHRVVGQNTHELGLYLGAVPLLLCVWLLARREIWGEYRTVIWLLLAGTAVAALLAAGEFGGLYRLQTWIPLANRFRFPCRAIVLVQLCLAALSAIAACRLFHQAESSSNQRLPRRILLATVAASIVLALWAPYLWPDHVAAPLLVWTGPLLLAVGALLLMAAQRGMAWAMIGLVVLTIVDLAAYGLSYSIIGRTSSLHAYVEQAPRPPQDGLQRVAVVETRTSLRTGDRMLLAGVQRVDGYAGLEPAEPPGAPTLPETAAAAGAAWLLHPESSAGESRWTQVASAAPRLRLVVPHHMPLTDPPLKLPDGEPGHVKLTSDAPGHIAARTNALTAQLLVTTERFDPGWTATVAGQTAPIVRVEGRFLGCVVPAGNQQVRLEFRPAARAVGLTVTCVGLGLLIAIVGFPWIGFRPWPATREVRHAS